MSSVLTEFGLPGDSDSKEPTCSAGDLGSIPQSGRPPREENGYPLQCSCLENSMDRGAWWAVVRGSQRVRHDWTTWTEQIYNIKPSSNLHPVLYILLLILTWKYRFSTQILDDIDLRHKTNKSGRRRINTIQISLLIQGLNYKYNHKLQIHNITNQ